MKSIAHYLTFACGWLAICLVGVTLGYALPVALVFFPFWIPFAAAATLLAFLCLATAFILSATLALSHVVEWRARRAGRRMSA